MVRLGNRPSINHHLEEEEKEEEEGTFEAGGPSRPLGPGAGQGQVAAGREVDMAPSNEGHGNGNVHNTLGSSAIRVRRVYFSPGVRTSPGKGGRRIGHILSPGRGARTPHGLGQVPGPNGDKSQVVSTHRVPPPRNSKTILFRPIQ